MKRFVFCLGTIMFLVILYCLFAVEFSDCFAADNTIRVSGIVTDNSGEAIPDATVKFISPSDTTRTQTDSTGIYSVELSPISTHVKESSFPEMFILRQNYPNPFNPGTVIEYEMKRQAYVKLDIYNILGQLVCNLHDGFKLPGIYRVRWDGCDNEGKGVSSGVYLYRLIADDSAQTKKMLLMDGGGSEQGFTASNTAFSHSVKVAKPALSYYDIVVGKVGYEACLESFFIVPDGVSELKKDFVLQEYDGFGIYLVYDTRWLRTADVDTLCLSQPAFLTASDITAYSWSTHIISFPDSVWERLKTWGNLLHRVFVVTVGDERIYWGMFMDYLDSDRCQNPVIILIPRYPGRNTTPSGSGKSIIPFRIYRGYPEYFGPDSDPDKRLDHRIYIALEKAGILVP